MENTIGQRVMFLRKHYNLSQKEFADKIGVSQTTIFRAEQGGGLTGKVVEKIARTFNVSYEWLLEGKGEPFKKETNTTNTNRDVWIEFKGFLKGLLIERNLQDLWQKIEPNFPKCRGVKPAW